MAAATGAEALAARLRFRHLQIVDMLARTGSLSRAAIGLHVTQPALSKALAEIEQALGFRVFERTPRGLHPTGQGEVVIRASGLMLEELGQMQREARALGPDGRIATLLRLGTPAFLSLTLLPGIVMQLTRETPPVRVSIIEGKVPMLLQALADGSLDALATVYDESAMAYGAQFSLQFEPVAREHYRVIAPPGHRLGGRVPVGWGRLASEPWVLNLPPSLARVFLEASFRRQGIEPPEPVCEADSPVSITRMVASGVGLGLSPESVAREAAANGAVIVLPVRPIPPSATLGLVYRQAGADHPRIDRLRHALRSAIDSSPSVRP